MTGPKGIREAREEEERIISILSQAVKKVGDELGSEWAPDVFIIKQYIVAEGVRRGRAILEEAIKHFTNSDIEVAGRILQEVEDGKRPGLGKE